MQAPKVNFLLTGIPGVGKTTAILRIAEGCADLHPNGFYTQEIRIGGKRQGFAIITFRGQQGVMAHISQQGQPRVGRYGVDVDVIDRLVVPSIEWVAKNCRLLIIDEIGKMELCSRRFGVVVQRALSSKIPVLGTIAKGGEGLIREIRSRDDVELLELTWKNRDTLPNDIIDILRRGLS